MFTNRLLSTALLLAGFAGMTKPQDLLAPTPPVGWNSWDSFGTTLAALVYGGGISEGNPHSKVNIPAPLFGSAAFNRRLL